MTPRLSLINMILLLVFGAAAAGCGRKPQPHPLPNPSQRPAETVEDLEDLIQPASYWADCRPIEPTLAHLFTHGRIVILPAESVSLPPEDYAFSVVDRFGNCHEFDTNGRWRTDGGIPLPEPLPEGQWDAAWNPRSSSLEVLVTAPYHGSDALQILRRRGGQWALAPLEDAPPAREDALRLYTFKRLQWTVAGGNGLDEAWTVEKDGWAAALASDQTTTEALARRPGLDHAKFLCNAPGGGLGLIGDDGAAWLWRDGQWSHEGDLPTENLWVVRYLPDRKCVMAIWRAGLRRDRIALLPFDRKTPLAQTPPQTLVQTATIRINDEDAGVWRRTGQLPANDPIGARERGELLEPGDPAGGPWAIAIEAEHDEIVIPAADIDLIEFPPALAKLSGRAAAFSPRLGGLVIPSRAMKTAPEPGRLPLEEALCDDRITTPSGALLRPVDTIDRGGRFWVFRGDVIEWIQSPGDIHPMAGYPRTAFGDGEDSRSLAWIEPAPGLIEYEYVQRQSEKVQWIRSPRLTLHSMQAPDWGEDAPLRTLPPVMTGDPCRIAIVGWRGRLGDRVEAGEKQERGYAEAPQVGFMALTGALVPRDWTLLELPIPYAEGMKVLATRDGDGVYLIGGRVARFALNGGESYYAMKPNEALWRWEPGHPWQAVNTETFPPALTSDFAAAIDPHTGQLMTLNKHGFYGYLNGVWQRHTDAPAESLSDKPSFWTLLTHPDADQVVAMWDGRRGSGAAVWGGNHWIPVRWRGGDEPEPGCEGIPAVGDEGFVLTGLQALSAWRLGAAPDPDGESIAASWIHFTAEAPPPRELEPDRTPNGANAEPEEHPEDNATTPGLLTGGKAGGNSGGN